VPTGAEQQDVGRRFGFGICLAFVFVRFTSLHEVLYFKLGFNTYLLYVLGVLVGGTLVMSGGIRRTLQWKPARCWTLFGVWLALTVPFSFWPGGSLTIVQTYWRTELLVLFSIAGLVWTWDEVWRLLSVLAVAALTTIVLAKSFESSTMDRITLAFGNLSDSNDLAAHLIFMTPLLMMVVLTPKRNFMLRFTALFAGIYGLYIVLSTGSRGALIGLMAMLVAVIWMIPARLKLPVGLAIVLTGAALIVALPSTVAGRFGTIVGMTDDSDEVSKAEGSTDSRTYLLKKSLLYTFRNPIFGVGPGEFADYEAADARKSQRRGVWHDTHNAYTQVSSEAGAPALLLVLSAIFGTFRLLRKTAGRAKLQPDTLTNRRIRLAAACLTTSLVGFGTSIFFLSLGYRYYMPAFAGLAIALHRAAEMEWAKQQLAGPAVRNKSAQALLPDLGAVKLGGRISTRAADN
jgi:hypothetical protein